MSGRIQKIFSNHWKTALMVVLLFAITFWIFWPATGYDFLNFDDDRYVSGNQVVRQGLTPESVKWAFRSVYESYWLPVMWLSYMTDTAIFGTEAFGYHFTNILLHAINAAIVFLLLQAWTKRFWPSVFVAALFAWHPLRVESVAWIAERKDVLSGFMVLLSLAFYKRFSRNPVSGREVWAALFMALGLMTKPILVTLPFLLLLLDYWPFERLSLSRDDLRTKGWHLISEKVLFWALTILFCFLTYYTQRIGKAIHGVDAIPWGQRLLSIPSAYLFYLEKTILPINLSMIYGDMDIAPPRVLIAVLLLLGITIAVLWAARRCRALPVGWFWFVGLLVPVIGIVRVGTTHVADRFTYLPSIGLGICAAWGAAWLLPQRRWSRTLAWCLGVAILAACVWQTRRVLPVWKNSGTAFENVLRHIPDNALANNNYGEALMGVGQTEAALRHFDKAISIDRQTTPFIANSALALVLLNRTDEAIARLDKALKGLNPRCPFLNFVMGLAWMEAGKPERAIPFLKSANEDPMIRPTWRVELARAYLEAGRKKEADIEFERVANQGWAALTNFEGMCNYYAALWQKGHGRRAWSFFERALTTHSNNVAILNNVAWFLATDRPAGVSSEEAVRLALRAKDLCTVVPPGIMDTLAAAYAANDEFEQAIRWSEQAQQLALSNGMAGLAVRIGERTRAYREGKVWGKEGPVRGSGSNRPGQL
jgi:Tfp pilus assembly protein PilF